LSDRYEEFTERGASIVAIGMGRPDMAAHFRDEREIPFPLIVDHDKETYRALEMKRGNLWDVSGPQNWGRFAKGIVKGHGVDVRVKQDPLQMGGAIVVDPGGEIRYVFRGSSAKETPDIEELLDALP
jgi:peroxiredoxin